MGICLACRMIGCYKQPLVVHRLEEPVKYTRSSHTLGGLRLNRGVYVLDLDVREDQSRLNSLQPSLEIYESGGKFINSTAQGVYALLALLLMVPVGICTIIRSAIVRREEKRDAFSRTCCLTKPGVLPGNGLAYAGWLRNPKPPRQWPFMKAGWFGLTGATTYSLVIIVMVVLQSFNCSVSAGFRVHVIRPEVKLVRSSGIQPLRVRVAVGRPGARPSLYVDSKTVAWADFGALLRSEISRRSPDWPVYLEGDRDLEWGSIAQAMDVIRGLRAEVVLLTPGTGSAMR
jgi:biopolymer transport protein ExbD